MTLSARLPALPDGVVVVEGDRGVLGCRAEDRDALVVAGFGPDGRHRNGANAELEDAAESGREPLGKLIVDGRECLARRFTHGGLARRLTGRRFRDPARPFVEFALSERLRALGVATPRVVAARAVPAPPFGYELTLVTERVPGTVDVGHLLGGVRRGTISRGPLRSALVAAGALIGQLHDAGLLHADLQPANVLVRDGEGDSTDAWILDLDGSRFPAAGALTRELRIRNLGRLWRHVARREAEYGAVLGTTDVLRFLRAYGVPRDETRATMHAIEASAASGGALHRLGHWLERTFGRAEDARAAPHTDSGTRG